MVLTIILINVGILPSPDAYPEHHRMYVCICKAVTDKQIRRARAEGLDTLEELRDALGVASGCGSCAQDVESILREPEARAARPAPRLYIPSAA